MAAELFDLSRTNDCPLEQGVDFGLIVAVTEDGVSIDLSTGYTAAAQVLFSGLNSSVGLSDLYGTTAGLRTCGYNLSAHPLPSTFTFGGGQDGAPVLAVRE